MFLEKYIAEWTESVSWEREQHWGQAREYEEGDLIRLARHAAPFKIPCAALSLLAGREEAIGPLEKMIDHITTVNQLADDLRDWREDLARGNYTNFLVQVMAGRGIRPPTPLNGVEVEKALFVGDAAGHVHPITGAGLAYALWSGKLAAEAIAARCLEQYEASGRQNYGLGLMEACRLMAQVKIARPLFGDATFYHLFRFSMGK